MRYTMPDPKTRPERLTQLIYAAVFFGIIFGASFIWRLATGDFPKEIPLIVIWLVALGALYYTGRKRLYSAGNGEA